MQVLLLYCLEKEFLNAYITFYRCEDVDRRVWASQSLILIPGLREGKEGKEQSGQKCFRSIVYILGSPGNDRF